MDKQDRFEQQRERTRQFRIDELYKFLSSPQVMMADKKYRKVIVHALRKIKANK